MGISMVSGFDVPLNQSIDDDIYIYLLYDHDIEI